MVLVFTAPIATMLSALLTYANVMVARIIEWNDINSKLRRPHKHDVQLLSMDKSNTLRCSTCEGYGLRAYQCPNGNASPMTWEDLLNYINYLQEVEGKSK